MNSGELLVIIVVALIVFGPKKLPMLAEHLGKLVKQINHLREQLTSFWQTQLEKQQLRENQERAEKVDAAYQNKNKPD